MRHNNYNKNSKWIVPLLAVFVLCSCTITKQTTRLTRRWQTAQVTNCTATIYTESQQYTTKCHIHTIRDSIVLVSVRPMLGIEVIRLEVTPQKAYIFDKINHRYSTVDMAKEGKKYASKLKWSYLQNIAIANKMHTGDQVTVTYSHKDPKTRRESPISITLTYGEINYNTPINISRINLNRYKFGSINDFFK